MSQRDMQHQVTVDGGASATDGYSPAGQAPPPATRLLDLPPVLLDGIACRVMQLGAESQLPLTCRTFSLARLLHIPALRIQLGRQCCNQLLTPRVVAALQARTSKLALTLWQPETEDSIYYNKQLAPTLQLPQTEYTQDYTDLLAHALAKLDKCAAVEVCKMVSSGTYDLNSYRHLHCTPGLAQQLLDSFPSLTALTLEGLCVSSDALASLLSHPPLALQLQRLDLTKTSTPHGDEPGAMATVLQGLRLKQLSIAVELHRTPPPPSLQPLAQNLTQLHLQFGTELVYDEEFELLVQYLQPLAQLQVLTLPHLETHMKGLAELLQALPQFHTLELPAIDVWGQQDLDVLLAATQITSLQLWTIRPHGTPNAVAPCSLQRLELVGAVDWRAIRYLPLHSLSQPLVLGTLETCVEDISSTVVAAALHILAEAIKVPVKITELQLILRHPDTNPITPALLQQQRVDLAQLVSLLQPLQCCCVGKVVVMYLHKVIAADVQALAPLCQDCTQFELHYGCMDPSLEFWRLLVQLIPTVQELSFHRVKGCVSAAMHQSLQLMAEQPWARWLDVTLHKHCDDSQLPACWQVGTWVKAGTLKVTIVHK